MKKLFSLLFVALLATTAWAADYVKVTADADLTNGTYLIVYEDGALAFDGGLEVLDAAQNTIAVTITDGKIASSEDVDAATFTIDMTAGTIKSASGFYIGRTGDSNGLTYSADVMTNTISIDNDGNAVIVASGGAYLRYNATSGQERFRYFKSSTYTNQKAIALYKQEGGAPVVTVAAPTFNPAGQEFEESIEVTLAAEDGATIYYNYDNGEEWTEYTEALTITETTTVYAKAEKDGVESAVVNATYTLKPAALEIDALEVTADMATNVEFTFTGDAVVTHQKGAYLWLRDDTGYGLIYGSINSGENPTFEPGTVLASGWTAKTSIYNGLMEFVNSANVAASDKEPDTELAAIQTITELNEDMINAYVQVLNVKSFTVSGKNVTANLADGSTMAMYKSFNDVQVPNNEGNYTVTGAVSIYNENLQLTIISIEGFVAAPTLPASCNFEESMTVEITNNEEGATVMYSTDNTTWNEYTEALTVIETTTVYAKAVKNGMESEVVSATYTKVDPAEVVTYTLVTDAAELADGDKIILVGFGSDEKAYAMADYRGDNYSNFSAIEVTVENNTVTTGLANVITLEANGDYWNLKAQEGYLYAAGNETTNKKNHMKVEAEPDAEGNANAAIYIATDSMSIVFQGDNTRNHLRFNYNNGSCLFSCYAQNSSVQAPAYIFKAKGEEPDYIRGDVNGDQTVTIADVTALIDILLSGDDAPAAADCNLDETVSIGDVTALIDYLLSGAW